MLKVGSLNLLVDKYIDTNKFIYSSIIHTISTVYRTIDLQR